VTDRRHEDLYLFQDRTFRDTLPHGVTLPTLVGQPASLAASVDELIGPFRPVPKQGKQPSWVTVITAVVLALAVGFTVGMLTATGLQYLAGVL